MRYSPDESKLAVGSHDNYIYIYNATIKNYSLMFKCVAHSSYIMAFDWDCDSSYIRSNCGAYELLFFSVPESTTKPMKLKNEPSGASNTRGTDWATQTCKLGWAVQGIYPPGTDGTHVNGVDCDFERNLLLTSDDFGLINLYNYPCLEENTASKSFNGHSEHVVRAVFANEGKNIISIGGYDQTIIQWKKTSAVQNEDVVEEEEKKEEKIDRKFTLGKREEDSEDEAEQNPVSPVAEDNPREAEEPQEIKMEAPKFDDDDEDGFAEDSD